MKRGWSIAAIVVVLVVAVGVWYWHDAQERADQGQPTRIAGSVTPGEGTFDPVLMPLYEGVTWGPVTRVQDSGLTGYEATSSAAIDTDNIASATTPFTDYYQQKLKVAGWQQDTSREAGGPGAEIEAYQKGEAHVMFGFTSVFKAGGVNEPEQCPCDVTLFIFSGTSTSAQ